MEAPKTNAKSLAKTTMDTETPLVSVSGLYRYYGDECAVHDLSFELRRGEVLGFLGPNGAGKSTTMQILSGTLAPSAGSVAVAGYDILDYPRQAKSQLGFLPELPPLYEEFKVNEYLHYCAALNRIPRTERSAAVDRAKKRCGLEDTGQRLIANLSKGFKQRIGIAQAIIHQPALVILDEPTVGLDPLQIQEIRGLIRELAKDHGVILSSHILSEVQSICDRVQIIHNGRLVYSDSMENLQRNATSGYIQAVWQRAPDRQQLLDIPGVEEVIEIGTNRFNLSGDSDDAWVDRLVEKSGSLNWGLRELVPQRQSLEQKFIKLTCGDAEPEEPAIGKSE